jgi:hypothetical protein
MLEITEIIKSIYFFFQHHPQFIDSVRGLFPEGNELYPTAGFQKQNIMNYTEKPSFLKKLGFLSQWLMVNGEGDEVHQFLFKRLISFIINH